METIELISKAYGSAAMSRAIVYRWYARFRDGREDVKDDARSGRPSTARTDENVESVRRLLTEDRRTTLKMIADRLNIGKETVRRIVTEDLGKRKICPYKKLSVFYNSCLKTFESHLVCTQTSLKIWNGFFNHKNIH